MIDQNVQNKNAIKNAANAETTAQANVTKNQGTAQAGLNTYLGANPGTAQAGNAPTSPVYSGANIPIAGAPRPAAPGTPGPGMMSVPGSGAAPGAGTQLPPQLLATLKQALQSGSA
jgi:hypothetical protein